MNHTHTFCFEEQVFRHDDWAGIAPAGKEFFECEFHGCDHAEADWSGAVFENCRFHHGSLMTLKLDKTGFREVSFHDCKLTGLDFSRCDTFSLHLKFEDCLLQGCNFTGLNLKRGVFRRCRLTGCDFIDGKLAEADFGGSVFEDTLFDDCDLRGADFRSASGYRINLTRNRIAKAKFSLPEAVALLEPFDLILD